MNARTLPAILKQAALTAALLGGLALSGAIAQTTVVEMKDLSPGDVRREGLVLEARQELRLRAVGAASSSTEEGNWFTRAFGISNASFNDSERPAWQGNAWILDARTRAVVWELRRAETEHGRRDLRTFDGTIRLPAGTYEVYYAAFPTGWQGRSWTWFSEQRSGRSRAEEMARDFNLTIRAAGDAAHRATRDELARARAEFDRMAIVSLRDVRSSAPQRAGFAVDRPTEVEVYAIGEARKDGVFDYGRIINADTHERVWQLEYALSDHAGGADKNRFERRTLRLAPGRYAAIYAADDSHDPAEWNGAPPYDPELYGLTIRLTDPSDRDHVERFDWNPWPDGTPVVSLIRVGDEDSRSAGFTLRRAASVRIYAIGEGSNGHLVDRGWIIDASTRRRVWSMDDAETEHAGGAEKNRLVDRVVRLQAGSYLVNYVSDDSHSYDEWNAAQPLDPEHWGISIYPATDADRSAFASYEEPREPEALAQLVRVGDDDHERARFTLDADTRVNIYAIGEGSDDEMFDYAWIENARTRETVWDMRERETTHAGGARKNRQVNEVIRLPAGEYILHYQSDGSHSYDDWNADPPDDPRHWGVTLYRARR